MAISDEVAVRDLLMDEDNVELLVSVGLSDRVCDSVCDGICDRVCDGVCDRVCDAAGVGLRDGVGETLAVGVID